MTTTAIKLDEVFAAVSRATGTDGLPDLEKFSIDSNNKSYQGVRYLHLRYEGKPILFWATITTCLDPVYNNGRSDGARVVFIASQNQVAVIYEKLADIATQLVRRSQYGSLRTTINANLIQRSPPIEIMRAIIPFAKTQGKISDDTVCSIPIARIEGERSVAQNVT